MSKRPLLLDLFSGAGGAARGYYDAGFEVVGVDIAPQKNYPYRFIQANALTFPLDGFDVIHASPPCQDYSSGAHYGGKQQSKYPRLLGIMRKRLLGAGKPWVLENVGGARPDMLNPVMICGTSLGLRVQRHRFFESNYILFAPGPCKHQPYDISVRCKRTEYLGVYQDAFTAKGQAVRRPPYCQIPLAREAMGIDWMTAHELGEAIPPAYTSWIAPFLLMAIEHKEVA
jgi:DNA (cytosine-5)-methyltransferase 1